MRVMFQSRRDLFTVRGGDSVIVEKTLEALGRLGVDGVFEADPEPDLSGFDLVHLFNLVHGDAYWRAKNARRQGRPLAVTTIYWNQDELLRPRSPERSDYVEPAKRRWRRRGWAVAERLHLFSPADARRRREKALGYALGAYGMAREVVGMADVLLPGSPSERGVLHAAFPEARGKPTEIAPYGVDPRLFGSPVPDDANRFLREHGVRDFLLCVGRVEPRKNQARLLEAAGELGLPVVLVGRATDPAYAAAVRGRLSPRDLWVEAWPHDAMRDVYSLARLHVLPSFNETPGLVNLEAGALGVPLVVGGGGSERDYLGEHAVYCDPRSTADIRRACREALARPRPAGALAAHVRGRFTWEHGADRVLAAYRRILAPSARSQPPPPTRLRPAEPAPRRTG